MTDNFVSKKCCHCGTVAEYPMPSDFKVAVPKYLDGKPFEDGNFELKRTVMRCPKCGYASFDVSKSILKDSSIVSSDEYESIIKSDLFPKYIANYIAIGYIYERQSEYYHASHAYLCAAWGCRDEKREKEAEILLEKAAKLILKHIGSSEFKAHPDLNMLQCAVDILRQIREFDNAKKLAAYALSKNLPEDMRKLFLLEQSLCDNYIYAPHAFKPQNETKITSLQELFNRFAEAKTGDDKMKLQAFADAFEFVNSIKYKDVEKGVWLVANPFLNQGFDFNKGVNLTRDALTEKKAPQKAAEMPIKPQQPVLKVFTKAEDLKPQQPEMPQETAPVEEEILVEEEPVETVTEPIEQSVPEQIEETPIEPPRPIKVFTSVDDLKAEEEPIEPEQTEELPFEEPNCEEEIPEEEVEEALEEPAYEEIEQPEPENIPDETEETFPEEQPISEETEDVDETEELDEPEEDEWVEETEQLPEEPVEEENFFEETEEEEDLQALDEAEEAEPLSDEEMEAPDDEPIDDQPLEDDFVEETVPEEEESLEEEEIEPETAPEEITEEEISDDRPLDDEEQPELPEEPCEEIDDKPEETVEETTVSEEESEDSDLDEPEDQPLEETAIEEEIPEEETETTAEPEEQLPEEEEETSEKVPEEPSEVTPEAQTVSETTQQTPETETEEEEEMEGFATTYEEQCETITTLASIDGAISVSEVQSLFEYGFVKARDILNRMADDGLLERTDDPENFRYVK